MYPRNKRYVLNQSVKNLVDDITQYTKTYTIFFTKMKLCKEIRYTCISNHYTKTIQIGTEQTQTLTYKTITKQAFYQAKKKQKGNTITKKRYPLQIENCQIFIDQYHKQLQGLYILEVPSKCHKHLSLITQKSLLAPVIESDITEDPRYEEKYLARFGNPSKHTYNIYAIFKDIQSQRINNLNNVLYKEMKSVDAIRIILYYQLHNMQKYAQKIRNSEYTDMRSVIAYTKLVHQSSVILKIFPHVFNKRSLQTITSHLTKITNVTHTFYDLMIINDCLTSLEKHHKSPYLNAVINNLENIRYNEYQKISRYFSSREYNIIMSQYDLFLKEKKYTDSTYYAQLPLADTLKRTYRNLHTQLLQLIDFLDGCTDKKSYQQIYAHIDAFAIFASHFRKHYPLKKHPENLILIQKADKLFAQYQKRKRELTILSMLTTMTKNVPNHTKLDKLLSKRIQRIHDKNNHFISHIFPLLRKLAKKRYQI